MLSYLLGEEKRKLAVPFLTSSRVDSLSLRVNRWANENRWHEEQPAGCSQRCHGSLPQTVMGASHQPRSCWPSSSASLQTMEIPTLQFYFANSTNSDDGNRTRRSIMYIITVEHYYTRFRDESIPHHGSVSRIHRAVYSARVLRVYVESVVSASNKRKKKLTRGQPIGWALTSCLRRKKIFKYQEEQWRPIEGKKEKKRRKKDRKKRGMV